MSKSSYGRNAEQKRKKFLIVVQRQAKQMGGRVVILESELIRGWVNCAWCRKPIDLSTSRVHATLDHIIPRVKGGTNRAENLQLMHLTCNREKNEVLDGNRRGAGRAGRVGCPHCGRIYPKPSGPLVVCDCGKVLANIYA